MRVVYVLCLVVAIGGQICNPEARRDNKETTVETESGNCFADNQLPAALSDLASGDPSRIDRAKSELLHKSKVSTACRGEVVRSLMKAMDKPDIDVNRDSSNFYLWLYGAEMLGELEATEALDLLISHLNLHHPVFGGPSLSKHPAKLGVITMGPIAIPKLSEALKNQSDPKIRYAAIYCIANIGGKSAITALREPWNPNPMNAPNDSLKCHSTASTKRGPSIIKLSGAGASTAIRLQIQNPSDPPAVKAIAS